MKNTLKKLLCICISAIFIFSTYSSTALAAFPDDVETSYKVEDISYEEYIELKSQMLGISQQELIAADNLRAPRAPRALNYVYKRYTQTFSYRNNTDFKADIVGLFRLYGENNYYDIISVDVGSILASGSSYATWTQAGSQVMSLSATQARIYATGKYTVSGSAGISLPGFSFSGNGYWTSGYHDMTTTVTAAMLKNYPSYG